MVEMSSYQASGGGHGKHGDVKPAAFCTAQTVEQLRRKIEELSAQQIELSEQREEALVDRQAFVQSATRVRKQLFKSASAATTLMNAFRKYYNEIGASLPEELTIAYKALDEEKDQLGALEVEHLQTEGHLGALEWKLTELEDDLYQYDLHQLLPSEDTDDINLELQEPAHTATKVQDPILASAAVQYQVLFDEYSQMVHHYEFLREEIAGKLIDESKLTIEETELQELANSGFVQAFVDLLNQIADCEVRLRDLKRQLVPHEHTSGIRVRRLSEPVLQPEKLCADLDVISLVQSESAVPDLKERASTLLHVRDWILDCLKQSALEKTQYLSILQQALAFTDVLGTNFAEWENLATMQWPFDTIESEEVPGIAIYPSTQATIRVASVGETRQHPEQMYASQHQIAAENKSSCRDTDPNWFSDLILHQAVDGDSHRRHSLTETLDTAEISIDANEEFAVGQHYRSQSTQTLVSTVTQEDTVSELSKFDATSAQNGWSPKAGGSQEVAVEQNDHACPLSADPKDTAFDMTTVARVDASDVSKSTLGSVSENSLVSTQYRIPETLARLDGYQDRLSRTEGSTLMTFEPRSMEGD